VIPEPPHPELARADIWAEAAGRLLADLGFSLVQGERPGAPGGSNLLVALRDHPTLRHFDPEALSYWTVVDGRGRLAVIDRGIHLPIDGTISWGSVRVVDRLGEENRFLTFGGTLRAKALDATLTVVGIQSPGPIVRWSGHSQGIDPLAGEVGAFFGRMMIPIDFEPGVETRLAESPPVVLYGAFLVSARARRAALPAGASAGPAEADLGEMIAAEARRLAEHEPGAWSAGTALVGDLGL
jgi:hypothetical protein